jgi:predicted transglutaminase-like cysteine proteinase
MTLKNRMIRWLLGLVLTTVTPTLQAQANLDRLEALAVERYGAVAAETVSNWRALLRTSASLSDSEKLLRINNFFNLRIYYDEDSRIWQSPDYWATPLETMGKARGDCEDYTIAKYVSLLLLGIPMEKLKLTYVNATEQISRTVSKKRAHMVLAYYPEINAEPLILDNLDGEIKKASSRPDLKPIYSFNSAGLWVAGETRVSGPGSRLSRWRDVLNRMRSEGL